MKRHRQLFMTTELKTSTCYNLKITQNVFTIKKPNVSQKFATRNIQTGEYRFTLMYSNLKFKIWRPERYF